MTIHLQRITPDEVSQMDDLCERPKDTLYQEKKKARNGGSPGASARAIFVDGEGINRLSDGRQVYVYISAWDENGLIANYLCPDYDDPNCQGITTEQAFWFLTNLPKKYKLMGFGTGYDVNMMLRNLAKFDQEEYKLARIQKADWTTWHNWHIKYVLHKEFIIRRESDKYGIKSAHLWDNFGFFQKSFVKTIEEWKVGTDEEREEVRSMKLSRDDFKAKNIKQITHYCDLECKLGAQVANKVIEHSKALGLKLKRYDGAGAIASAMFEKHGVSQYMHQQNTVLAKEVICGAYFGGRFDLSTFGECGDAHEYDINSAYPYIALSLPCLSCSTWEYIPGYERDIPWAVWNVSWSLDESAVWSPLPYRYPNRHIKWLRNGQGWYWSNELSEALALYPDAIQVRGGYVLRQNCDHQPFEFINRYYNQRQLFIRDGNLAELIIKLGLNAAYGKLAQGVGYKDNPPKTQCLIWAGMITAGARAMILRAIRENPDDVILVATDAVFKRSLATTLELNKDKLGAWKHKQADDLFIVTNGFYTYKNIDNDTIKNATRGFSARDIYDPNYEINHWDLIRDQAKTEDLFEHTIPVRHFYGMGETLGFKPKLYKWLTWEDKPETITYGKFLNKLQAPGRRLMPLENKYPDLMSTPHNPDLYREDGTPMRLPDDIYADFFNSQRN